MNNFWRKSSVPIFFSFKFPAACGKMSFLSSKSADCCGCVFRYARDKSHLGVRMARPLSTWVMHLQLWQENLCIYRFGGRVNLVLSAVFKFKLKIGNVWMLNGSVTRAKRHFDYLFCLRIFKKMPERWWKLLYFNLFVFIHSRLTKVRWSRGAGKSEF